MGLLAKARDLRLGFWDFRVVRRVESEKLCGFSGFCGSLGLKAQHVHVQHTLMFLAGEPSGQCQR